MPKTPPRRTEATLESGLTALTRLAQLAKESSGANLDAVFTELQDLLNKHHAALENISQGVCFFDGESRLILCNSRYGQIYRLAPEDIIPGRKLEQIVTRRIAAGTCTETVESYLAKADAINSAGKSQIWSTVLPDGRVIQINHQPMPDGGWVSTHEDITELQAQRVVASERLSLQALIDLLPDFLWVKDTQSKFVIANLATARGHGRERTSDMIGLSDSDLHPVAMAEAFHQLELDIIASGDPMIDREETIVGPAGETRWMLSTKVPLRDNHGDVFGLVGVSRDITERKLAEQRIEFMANHDSLTGLPNRALLKDRIEQAMLWADRGQMSASIVFVDLDNFKLVNDSLGHNAGDELLKLVASRMVSAMRPTDTVVRLGGDEFVILLPELPRSPEIMSATLERLRRSIAEPAMIEGHELHVTCSIGIATYPGDGADAEMLLASADAAMYRAKETGRDNFQFYTPQLNQRVHEKFSLQHDLAEALARRQLSLDYQPQLDLRTGRVIAVEALLRWDHPTLGRIPPVKFIPLAEESGLIVEIGDWVINEACRQNKGWQEVGLPPLRVCVNVSARQFKERNLVERVTRALDISGLAAHDLELELTESLIMQDIELAVATMNQLEELGVQLAIDDFGTGYSSLSSLKTFPVARLKIDKSFVDNLPDGEQDKAVATAVISLGQRLNMRVIAEGVETAGQLDFLRSNNCDEIQGYHLSRPIPAARIPEFLLATMDGSAAHSAIGALHEAP